MENKPIKRTNRELVYKGAITELYKDTIEDKDGHIQYYDFIKHKGVSCSYSRYRRRKAFNGPSVQKCVRQIYHRDTCRGKKYP